MRIAAVALAVGFLSACDRASRDVGADMAACNLEEMKTNYPSKARLWREPEPLLGHDRQMRTERLLNERRQFLKWCMRVRGWYIPIEQNDRSAQCYLHKFDQAKCYEPATPAGDGIVK